MRSRAAGSVMTEQTLASDLVVTCALSTGAGAGGTAAKVERLDGETVGVGAGVGTVGVSTAGA